MGAGRSCWPYWGVWGPRHKPSDGCRDWEGLGHPLGVPRESWSPPHYPPLSHHCTVPHIASFLGGPGLPKIDGPKHSHPGDSNANEQALQWGWGGDSSFI